MFYTFLFFSIYISTIFKIFLISFNKSYVFGLSSPCFAKGRIVDIHSVNTVSNFVDFIKVSFDKFLLFLNLL